MPGINFDTIKNAIASFLGQSEGENAIDMLIEDHRRVKQICETYKDMDDEEKVQSVHKVLVELALHAAVEEQLVYPLLGEVGERDGMNESKEEHHVIKFLMSELETMHEADEHLDAKFKVLSEIVDHHVKEEELEYFPKLRGKEEIDLQQLGQQLAARKEELLQKLGDESVVSVIDPELRAHRNGKDNGAADVRTVAQVKKPAVKTSGKLPTGKAAATVTKSKIEAKATKKASLSKAKPAKKSTTHAKKSAAAKAPAPSKRTKVKATQPKTKPARGKKSRAA
jgi:hypothetical protein